MKLTFTKGAGKFDRLDITTDAGPQPPIDCPKQGIIPHDMVHFAVESGVSVTGFLGGIAAGGDAGFAAGGDDPHHRAVERLVETFQAEAWGGAAYDDADFIALYHVTCAARSDSPLALDGVILGSIRARLAALAIDWAALPVGGAMALVLGDE